MPCLTSKSHGGLACEPESISTAWEVGRLVQNRKQPKQLNLGKQGCCLLLRTPHHGLRTPDAFRDATARCKSSSASPFPETDLTAPTSHIYLVYFASDADPLRNTMWQARHGESAATKNRATAWPKLRVALCALCARTRCHLRPQSGKQQHKLSSSAHAEDLAELAVRSDCKALKKQP